MRVPLRLELCAASAEVRCVLLDDALGCIVVSVVARCSDFEVEFDTVAEEVFEADIALANVF